jgi:stage IV sporulation protein FB
MDRTDPGVGLVAELGHAVAFKFFGHEPEIHLMGIFGLTYSRTDRPLSNLRSLLISAAGPIAGLLLAGACLVLRVVLFPTASDVLARLVVINLLLNLANLLPVVPLDGGRIMKALLDMAAPNRGGMIAHAVSLVVAAGALWYAMTHQLEITALMLLGIAALNFSALRSNGRSSVGAQPSAVPSKA